MGPSFGDHGKRISEKFVHRRNTQKSKSDAQQDATECAEYFDMAKRHKCLGYRELCYFYAKLTLKASDPDLIMRSCIKWGSVGFNICRKSW